MTTRIGTDTVEIERIRSLIESHGERFQNRFFTGREQQYIQETVSPACWYARFWAGREAIFKIFGTGNYWTELEFSPREMGRLDINFTGDSFHKDSPVPRNACWDVSTDHNNERAVAVAVCQWD